MARILVIDDDEEIRLALKRLFQGHEVVLASTSEEGIELYRKDPVDVVITDIFVPVEGGLEVIRKLKQSDPGVKIVAITGFGIRDDLDTISLAKRMGATLGFEKPMDFVGFKRDVEALISK